MADWEAVRQLGGHVITPQAPSGGPVEEAPAWDALRAEMGKIGSLHVTAPVNWAAVVSLGSTILQQHSKHLLVASYLSRGLFACHGYAGLEAGLALYHDLLTTHWESLFPPKRRMRGRSEALRWLVEEVGKAVTQRPPTDAEADAVQRCVTVLQPLADGVHALMGQEAPAFSLLLGQLHTYAQQWLSRSPTPPAASPPQTVATSATASAADRTAAAPAETPSTAVPAAAGALPLAAAAPAVSSMTEAARAAVTILGTLGQGVPPIDLAETATDEEISRSLRPIQEVLSNAAVALFRTNRLADPRPYKLARMAAWLRVSQAPAPDPQRGGMITRLPGPDPALLGRWQQALQMQQFANLIMESEQQFAQSIFWLDTHRYTALALEGLGYTVAKHAVIEELAALLRRFPPLLDLHFAPRADGTALPFAEAQTRLWIAHAVLPDAAASTPAGSAEGEDASPPGLGQAMQDAQQLAAQGELRAALSVLQAGSQQAASQRERFLWRWHLARLSAEAGRLDLAIPQLEWLEECMQRFALEEWEPALCVQVLSLLHACYSKRHAAQTPPSEVFAKQVVRIYNCLCRLDVTALLAANPLP